MSDTTTTVNRRSMYRGRCRSCRWFGRALASRSPAQFAAAKHWRDHRTHDTYVSEEWR